MESKEDEVANYEEVVIRVSGEIEGIVEDNRREPKVSLKITKVILEDNSTRESANLVELAKGIP